MGLLSPLFLLAAAAVAVPLVLHLFHRHDAKRVVFPAIRYLLRTEKEHARTIRARQLLLLFLRVSAILLVAIVAARPFLRGQGGVHEPTALVIVLDNSMSSSRVEGEVRTLDRLKAAARASLERAGSEDRTWLLRAGEPWTTATEGTPAELTELLDDIESSAAGADLAESIVRAASLVSQSGLESGEIHLLSDLQAGGFDLETSVPLDNAVLVVYAADPIVGENAFLDTLQLDGGVAPMANELASLAVRLGGVADSTRSARLVVEGRIRGAARARAGEVVVFPFGPYGSGTVTGYVETDPDALAADDRRYFAVSMRPPSRLAVLGDTALFLGTAISVLEAAGRVERVPLAEADVVIAGGGAGLTGAASAIVVPEADPTSLPALNRRLASAGIPWRYELTSSIGEAAIVESRVPLDLSSVRVRTLFQLRPASDSSGTLVRLSSGEPWLVEARGPAGRYLLLASPLEEAASSLPVTAVMIPMMDWMIGTWSVGGGASGDLSAGDPLPLPMGATAITDPSGSRHAVSGGSVFTATGLAGLYTVHGEDDELALAAVNPDRRESLTRSVELDALDQLFTGDLRIVAARGDWPTSIFVRGQGPEIWRPLLLALLLLLVVESLVAADGHARGEA
jgi:hypothetical protein